MQTVEDVLQQILDLYTLDFSKYANPVDIPRINNLWNSLPSQLGKENRKFIYNVIKSGARAREYEDALLWLEENAILQALVPQSDGLPYYWNSGNRAEVDFLLQKEEFIIPIEVKAQNRISGKSLFVYTTKFTPTTRIRYSINNLKINDGLLSLPSFLADWTYHFCSFL